MASQSNDPKLDEFIEFLKSLSEIPLSPWQKEIARAIISGKQFHIRQGRKGPYIEVSA